MQDITNLFVGLLVTATELSVCHTLPCRWITNLLVEILYHKGTIGSNPKGLIMTFPL